MPSTDLLTFALSGKIFQSGVGKEGGAEVCRFTCHFTNSHIDIVAG